MSLTRRQACTALGAGLLHPALQAAESGWPSKSIKVVMPYTPGGGADENARAVADELQRILKVPVVVENRPGAVGAIAASHVIAQPADGYTLLVAPTSVLVVNLVTVKDLSYDPFRDLTPVHGLNISAPFIVAPANTAFAGLKQALQQAKAAGRPLNIGNYTEGYKLLATWVTSLEGAPATHITYKGPANMMIDLVGGRLDLGLCDATSAVELIKAGKVKALVQTGATRDAQAPDVPTMKELGYAELESYVWSSLSAKAGTPAPIVDALSRATAQALKSPTVQRQMQGKPGTTLDYGPADMLQFQRRELARYQKMAALTQKS
ncbi:tripartite tricarboxylate transporter substrate binding protein [Comamonas serinivorans]|nr:tripartite tricarboxylate transporter substrate binding protein [Comamonas serinivorans]